MAEFPENDQSATAEMQDNLGKMTDKTEAAVLGLGLVGNDLTDIENFLKLGNDTDVGSCYSLFPHLPVGGLAENNTRGQPASETGGVDKASDGDEDVKWVPSLNNPPTIGY